MGVVYFSPSSSKQSDLKIFSKSSRNKALFETVVHLKTSLQILVHQNMTTEKRKDALKADFQIALRYVISILESRVPDDLEVQKHIELMTYLVDEIKSDVSVDCTLEKKRLLADCFINAAKEEGLGRIFSDEKLEAYREKLTES
jgi:hypothetical protein